MTPVLTKNFDHRRIDTLAIFSPVFVVSVAEFMDYIQNSSSGTLILDWIRDPHTEYGYGRHNQGYAEADPGRRLDARFRQHVDGYLLSDDSWPAAAVYGDYAGR